MTAWKWTVAFTAIITTLASPVLSQSLIEVYTAEIGSIDRRNSSGTELTDPVAMLTQDRANVHRFGHRQAGDTIDGVFQSSEMRAQMPTLFASGDISPAAEAALRSGATVQLEVHIWAQSTAPSHLTVDLAEPLSVTADGPPLSPSELTQAARGIQSALNARGFEAGTVDGQPGLQTRTAIAAFQNSIGASPTGTLTRSELEILTGGSDGAPDPGPSFDCAQAETQTEFAICTIPSLSALDRDLAAAWAEIQGSATRRAQELPLQIAWLTRRNTCGADASCLADAMTSRLEQLQFASASEVADSASQGASSSIMTPDPESAVAHSSHFTMIDSRVLMPMGGYAPRPPQNHSGEAIDVTGESKRLAEGLFFAAYIARSETPSDDALALYRASDPRLVFSVLPLAEQRRLISLSMDLENASEPYRNNCMRDLESKGAYSAARCVLGRDISAFDQLRLDAEIAETVINVAQRLAVKTPLLIRVVCGINQVDQAYDFDRQEINWSQTSAFGGCRVPNFGSAQKLSLEYDFELSSAIPKTTPMRPDEAERLTDLTRTDNRYGSPLLITFPGEIVVQGRDLVDHRSNPPRIRFSRTGPADLRWSGDPARVLMSFEGTADFAAPTEAIDLGEQAAVAALLSEAKAFEPAASRAAAAALIAGEGGNDGPLVRLPAYLRRAGINRDGPLQFHLSHMRSGQESAGDLSRRLRLPADHIGSNQMARQNPYLALHMVLPRPLDQVLSVPVGDSLEQVSGLKGHLIGRLRATYDIGPTSAGQGIALLVAPLRFEATEMMPDGSRRVLEKFELVPDKSPAFTQVFAPTAFWFLLKSAEARGLPPKKVFLAAIEQANLFHNDVLAREDAINAAIKQARASVERNATQDVWVIGNLTLANYDLEDEAYPIQNMRVIVPFDDEIERDLARYVVPELSNEGLQLPLLSERARAMREEINAGQYRFRARIALTDGEQENGRISAEVLELHLLPRPTGSRRTPVSTSFREGDWLLSVVYEKPNTTAAQDSPAPSSDSVATVSERADEGATVTPEAEVATMNPPKLGSPLQTAAAEDILGLELGMTLEDVRARVSERMPDAVHLDTVRGSVPEGAFYGEADAFVDPETGETIIAVTVPTDRGREITALMRYLSLPPDGATVQDLRATLQAKYGPPTMEFGDGKELFWGTPARELDGYGICARRGFPHGRPPQFGAVDGAEIPPIGVIQKSGQIGDYGWPTHEGPEVFFDQAKPHCGNSIVGLIVPWPDSKVEMVVWMFDLNHTLDAQSRLQRVDEGKLEVIDIDL